jgi:predicted SAM-dependent methyltransferase
MGIKLEIGCGRHPKPGYEHLDCQPFPHVEYVADARKLPFADNSLSVIYSQHVIEHFWWFETENMFKEWYRALEPNGLFEASTPDMENIIRMWQDGSWIKEVRACQGPGYGWVHNSDKDRNMWLNFKLHGTHWPTNIHLTAFTFELLKTQLTNAGFKDIVRINWTPDTTTLHVTARK